MTVRDFVDQGVIVGIEDLHESVDPLKEMYPDLSDDRRFAMWFTKVIGAETLVAAEEALPGPGNEKGVDALYVDEVGRRVIVVQAKYHTNKNPKAESWSEVNQLIATAAKMLAPKSEFDTFCASIEPRAAVLLGRGRERIQKRDFNLEIAFVTTGSISPDHVRLAEATARRIKLPNGRRAQFEDFRRARVIGLVERELDGATPPVAPFVLPMPKTKVQHFEKVGSSGAGLTMWTFGANGKTLADLVAPHKTRIYNANVRGFLGVGEKGINSEILKTIQQEPHHFVFANNGVTITCEDAHPDIENGEDVLVVSGAQIVNGQQTSRVLIAAGKDAANVTVIVRVIQVPDELKGEAYSQADLVNLIVRATNRQNPVTNADLMSNDRKQIWLEEVLASYKIRYVRKREDPRETGAGRRGYKAVKKEKLAQAIAACETNTLALLGSEPRFGDHYGTLFKSNKPTFYAVRFFFFSRVTADNKGSDVRTWGRFAVIRTMWTDVLPLVQSRARAEILIAALQRKAHDPTIDKAMVDASGALFGAIQKHYQVQGRDAAGNRIDAQKFFKKRDAFQGFSTAWTAGDLPGRKKYEAALERLNDRIGDVIDEEL